MTVRVGFLPHMMLRSPDHAAGDDDHDAATAYDDDEDSELDENDQCLFPAC